MQELIAHLLGDYVFQNHWMAVNKTKNFGVAFIHAVFYGFPFLLLASSWNALAIIVLTHAFIDRFQVAKYWCEFWGVGTHGHVMSTIYTTFSASEHADYAHVNDHWYAYPHGLPNLTSPIGVPDAPPFLAVWLKIIVDNTMHLAINHYALNYL